MKSRLGIKLKGISLGKLYIAICPKAQECFPGEPNLQSLPTDPSGKHCDMYVTTICGLFVDYFG
jgi:hypothetical protein